MKLLRLGKRVKQHNPKVLDIFLFFIYGIISRISIITLFKNKNTAQLIKIDSCISVCFFLYSFSPLIY